MAFFIENEPTSPVNYRYPVKPVVYRGKSSLQKVLVFDSPFLGRVLALANIVQLTTREEFLHHEMLVHPVLHATPGALRHVGPDDHPRRTVRFAPRDGERAMLNE
jgi:spermidine synthase